MTAAFKDLCLVNCAADATTALMAIHKHLGDIAVRRLPARAHPALQGGALSAPKAMARVRQAPSCLQVPGHATSPSDKAPPNQPPTPPQNKYNTLQSGAEVPITLHSDLVRLTKLAKVGQTNLVDATRQCCSGSASNPFAPFTNNLEALIAAATVNVSAIAAAVVTSDGVNFAGPPAARMSGRLLDNGGVKDCKVRARGRGGGGGRAPLLLGASTF